MKIYWTSGMVLVIVVPISLWYYFVPSTPKLLEETRHNVPEVPLKRTQRESTYVPLSENDVTYFQGETYTFFCKNFYETYCRLHALQVSDSSIHDLALGFEATTPLNKDALPSPNLEKLLILTEKQATILDTKTLETIIVADAPRGLTFGTYTDFPSFVRSGLWLDDHTIELHAFKEYTKNQQGNENIPLSKIVVSLD